eukprot:scaffold106_cov177-Ochromonas_danica.AAC.2
MGRTLVAQEQEGKKVPLYHAEVVVHVEESKTRHSYSRRHGYEDEKKLKRVLSYLYGIPTLCGSKGMNTGIAISRGKGAIYSHSFNQELVAKSSTEAELVGSTTATTTSIPHDQIVQAIASGLTDRP